MSNRKHTTRHIRDIFSEMAREQIDFSNSPSLTKSEFAEEADINNIVATCIRKAMPLPTGDRQPLFEDFSDIGTYQDALNGVAQANQTFEQLPSGIRQKFDHNVQSLIDFLADPENNNEAKELGLLPSDSAPEAKNLDTTELETNSSEEDIQKDNSES